MNLPAAVVDGEAILGRIRAHLGAWRDGKVHPGLIAALRDEFRAMQSAAAAAGLDDIERLCGAVERFLLRGAEIARGDDNVSSLNLLEEVHDGLMADLGFVTTAARGHAKLLHGMMTMLLPGESADTPSRPPTPRGESLDALARQLRDAARQTATRAGRQVDVSTNFSEVEVDREVLARIRAPLQAMIGAAIARSRRGAVEIRLSATKRDDDWLLEYADDAGQPSPAELAARAVALRLTDAPDKVADAHRLQIVTHPNFIDAAVDVDVNVVAGIDASVDTNQSAGTSVNASASTNASKSTSASTNTFADSARALRAYLATVAELGGLLALDSRYVDGLHWQCSLPHAHGMRVLLATIGERQCALPTHLIARIVHLRAAHIGEHAVQIDGEITPRLQVGAAFGATPPTRIGKVAVLRLGDRIGALVATRFDRVVESVGVSPPQATHSNASPKALSGVALLADSRSVALLNPRALLSNARLQSRGLALFPLAQAAPKRAADSPRAKMIALDTAAGALLMPAERVAAIADAGAAQPSLHAHRYVCGEIEWGGLQVPMLSGEALFSGRAPVRNVNHSSGRDGQDGQSGKSNNDDSNGHSGQSGQDKTNNATHAISPRNAPRYAAIMRNPQRARDEFFAIAAQRAPRVIEIESAAAEMSGDAPTKRIKLADGGGVIVNPLQLARELFGEQ